LGLREGSKRFWKKFAYYRTSWFVIPPEINAVADVQDRKEMHTGFGRL